MADRNPLEPLSMDTLRWRCDVDCLPFETTAELDGLTQTIGQERAVDALNFALAMDHPGYNVYVLGPDGVGRHRTVRRILQAHAAEREACEDWVLVADFNEPREPRLMRLPRGIGRRLRGDMARFVQDLVTALKNAFDNDEYKTNAQAIEHELEERRDEAVADVQEKARVKGITLVRSPMGLAFAPMQDGKVVAPEAFQELPEEQRQQIQADIEALQSELQERLSKMPEWVRETRTRVRELNQRTAAVAVDYLVSLLESSYADLEPIKRHLEALRADVAEQAPAILEIGASEDAPKILDDHPLLRRYRVNLLVDHAEAQAPPVIYEDDPTYDRLVGRIDHRVVSGALVTDFLMVHAGAIQRANGGYLVVDARKLLTKPQAYEALKRAIHAGCLRIEPLAQALGMMSGESLEPEPMPLDLKVVLVGERQIYYMLAAADPGFGRLFKIAADFDDRVRRDDASQLETARLMATIAGEHGLGPLHRDAVVEGLRFLARRAGDTERLDTNAAALADLLREADHLRKEAELPHIGAEQVVAAISRQQHRLGRIRETSQEMIQLGTINIATDGKAVGQVNGLSVLQIGALAFGKPSRITARVRMGSGHLVDIEREVKLGGPLHSKGVLILGSYLSAHYACDLPLSLRASLVFEQSYGGVDGDSASAAELLALLSAVSAIPLDQGLAITGSIDQWGSIQAIGGVNEKIEGFFDICEERGLTGAQGVLIPATNVRHLVLDDRVLRAIEAGRFRVHAVATIEDAIELMSGMQAGSQGEDGGFPEGTFNAAVRMRLHDFAEARRNFGKGGGDKASRSEGDDAE